MAPGRAPREEALSHLRWLMDGWQRDWCVELRVLPRDKRPLSGLFATPEDAAAAAAPWLGGRAQVYAGLNPRKTDPRRMARLSPGVASGAASVAAVTNVMLDFDPVRAEGFKGQPSSREELDWALQRARAARDWLTGQGFVQPLVLLSGNGVHLVLKVPPQDPAVFPRHLQRFLEEMATRFDGDGVDLDGVVFDAPRIAKLAGALSIKGEHRPPDRPWRRARILRWAEPVPDARLAGHIASLEPTGTPEAERGTGLGGPPGPEWALRHTLRHCRFIAHCREHARDLPEPLWYAMITNLAGFGEPGRQAIHELSAPYPGYSREETDRKIAHALKSAPGPIRCRTLAQLGWRCPLLDTCPAGESGAPASLGYAADRSWMADAVPFFERERAKTLTGVPADVRALLAAASDPRAADALVRRAARELAVRAGYSAGMIIVAIAGSALGHALPPARIEEIVRKALERGEPDGGREQAARRSTATGAP